MNIVLFGAGLLVITTVMFDALVTTLGMGGAGPLTARLSRFVWQGMRRLHRLLPGGALLRATGTTVLIVAVLTWVVLLWAGWTCLFSADPSSVIHGQTKAPAPFWSRAYFTGFTVFTLGVGDYVPQGTGWQVAVAVASFNGLFLVTLAITYLVPVVSAVVEKRQLAGAIFGLGDTPQTILTHAWNGESFAELGPHLAQLSSQIGLHAQRHLAYPVIHYFHSTKRQAAIAPAVAVLYEALLLLSYGAAPQARPAAVHTRPAREAIDELLSVLEGQHLAVGDESAPEPAELDALRESGIPLVDTDTFRRRLGEHAQERKALQAYAAQTGWSWQTLRPDARVT